MADIEYACGQDWYVEAEKPSGGFCFLHYERVMRTWRALLAGELELRDVRVWLACHEMRARRCVLEAGRSPRYGLDELQRLVGGVGGEHLRASVRRLERAGLLVFRESELVTSPGAEPKGRLVPAPRSVLRMLARARGRAFVATTLGHLLRCLFYRKGVCRSGGWCKASWVAETFGVAMRAVREARVRLVGLGLLRLLEADQLRLNRLGRPLVVELGWRGESAPRAALPTTESAPPREHKELSSRRVDHQKPARSADPAGARTRAKDPDLNNVTEADLKDPWRLAALFKQARLRGWVHKTEAHILAVFTAAAHAVRVGHNKAGLFRWLVERRAWDVASNADEDMARTLIHLLRC